jgi:hypothetical protein
MVTEEIERGYRSRSNGLSEVKGNPPDSNILRLGIEFEGE